MASRHLNDRIKASFELRWMDHLYRPHTTAKHARNIKSVSQAKVPYFEVIFKL